ncbi:sugar porter family MFS transporter [Legionella pneumophila]|uniref:D-xylose (Galactose, arabinose)-proton symporter n=1 Tax=Legionella pneumophila subsp. pascullei TaxID=91890 RepID=A0AAX2IZL2_LEGPN|nr:sugar porter family MFS transporter [Legionella pneumophila]AMP88933.1 MFS transporter [Legionella pneumophila subsp. pascullei]AMP93400.1 sugar:proton symporter [Legionella pneumophila subsp. pascullei]AMP96366.1 sugar:proton symporter [Legionella pneumophila subsp. pascullei]SQG91336.1 D-xylose (galactose, arabinose)-proton symporter [Legionella pneumophila subsp. pascullei]VEH07882.1 D-xylose (galactose, arabinose)-proton symporter [Legionella pneumophila subsp. pascullei]
MAWLVAIIGSLAGFLFGYDEGIIAGSLELIKHYFHMSHTSVGMMTSALPFGALFGAMLIGSVLASRLVRHFGRKPCLIFAGILFLIGALGAAFSFNASILVLSRFILGIAIGVAAVTTPLYLSETAPTHLRGAMVAIYQLAITIGIVCSYGVNYLLIDYGSWRVMFASSIIPALILVIGISFMPESPRWLLNEGRRKEAKEALDKLRGDVGVADELHDIQAALDQEPEQKNWQLLFKKPLLPALSLGVILFCLQQLSGINVIIYYAPEIFKNLGFSSTHGQILATMGIGLVNMLVTILAVFYVDKIGRRNLLLLGFTGTSISLAAIGIFSYYQVAWLAYLSVTCLTLYIFSFAISLGPIPYIAMSEIFPLYVRGAGMGLSSISNWGFNGIVVFTFPVLFSAVGLEYTFLIYACICFLGLIYTFIFMPETKNLSLEYIEEYIVSGKSLRWLGRKKH